MNWLNNLLWSESAAQTIFLYSIVIATGVFLGKRKIRGVSLGITFVLFAGIIMGHFGFRVNTVVAEFIRDFGLILFVFSIGLQVGPGFFSSFRKGGAMLNILAAAIVLLGVLITLAIHFVTGAPLTILTGIMSGAVTNTPGLGAAQNALAQTIGVAGGVIPDIGLGYAVAYPFGVLGIILTMAIIRRTMKIDVGKEAAMFMNEQHPADTIPEKINILVNNPLAFNRTVGDISRRFGTGFVISRVLHKGELLPATSETVINENDIILVVAQKGLVPEILANTGIRSEMDLSARPGSLISRRLIVTNREIIGKTLGSLKLRTRFNINITRVYRSGIEFIPSPGLQMQMGDRLTVVGDEKSVETVTSVLGNSMKRLEEPDLIPIFIGIMAGVLIGSIPFKFPGLVYPIKLGIAGGPLIIAILLSRFGHKFSLVSYTTASANLMLREIGIVLFLASVGIMSGEKFIPSLINGEGFIWMFYGVLITMIPILATGFFSRIVLKRNYLEICGLLSGSMTDPPALAFAAGIARSEAPAIAYAAVYPLVMFLRIFMAQLLIILFL
ncbi:MAG TPA: putative transporter [Bacteroidales bacterium]|nr:putative transporter [Bacteroidales bacterium]